MRKALRLACASTMPHSRPRRRASSTETYSTRLVISFSSVSPLFDSDSRELRDFPVLRELVAHERAELLGRAGPRLDAELRIGVPDFRRRDGLHDDVIQPRHDVLLNGGGHEHAVPP